VSATAIPTGASTVKRRTVRRALGLAGFLAASASVAVLGGLSAAEAVDSWYQAVDKPAWTPPDAAFGPVWTVLYTGMAVAAWRVWDRHGWAGARRALATYGVQLALNCAWTPVFFGARQVGAGLAVILALDVAVFATILAFRRLDRAAAALLVPYLAWCLYASTVNAGVVALK
jgi:tryptophan-rich sensory protein